MIFQFKSHVSLPVEAQVVGERLERLRKKHDIITPALVVHDAEDNRSVLHPCFEWDDSKAAKAHREDQARYILRSVTVEIPEREKMRAVRAFVHVETEEAAGYTSIEYAMGKKEMRQQIIDRALSELGDWQRRYDMYEELGGVFAAIDTETKKITKA